MLKHSYCVILMFLPRLCFKAIIYIGQLVLAAQLRTVGFC